MLHKNLFIDALLSFTVFWFLSALLRLLFDGGNFISVLHDTLPIAIGFVLFITLFKLVLRRRL